MHGALLIDTSAPHVTLGNGGGIHVDGRVLQWDWRRWADGQFTPEERAIAKQHRAEVAEFDPEAFRNKSKATAQRFCRDCKTMESLLARIDSLINDPAFMTQELILALSCNWLCATEELEQHLLGLLRGGRIKLMRHYAPFATSITRLVLAYQFGLGRGFIGPRKSDICDLEYLFYAPFCRIFVSNDRLHKMLWKASTTRAFLRADLKQRAEIRKASPEKVAGLHPIPLESSALTKLHLHLQEQKRRENNT